ncbi:MAG: hypothetical protein HUU41_20360 [Bryobacteraceae bacterium]|nr:hypothetical protein [Bryobacterales bacterium]NUN03467.1 hypothetical protein [Bryobacteraceae bacterium]
MTPAEPLPIDIGRYRTYAAIGGVAGLAACVLGWLLDPGQFFHSYLFGFMFWFGIGSGCLAVLMLHHMVGGEWGFVIRRLLETGTRTVPLMALLFIPILFGIPHLYEWSHPEVVANDHLLQEKQAWLNVPFFIVRVVIYFAIWIGLAFLLNRFSGQQDVSENPALPTRRLRNISGPGIILWGLAVTFASIDWVMSMEPHWFSTMYGALYVVGQSLSAFAFTITVVILLSTRPPLSRVLGVSQLHDLGNLLFAFVMLWAYVSFSQFLIIWSGNITEEIPWYLRRTSGGWVLLPILLIAFHFTVPFFVLLMRDVKRRANRLVWIAVWIVLMRLVDLFWLIEPAYHGRTLFVHWLDLAAPIGIGGLWIAWFLWQLPARPLVPLQAPQMVNGETPHAH